MVWTLTNLRTGVDQSSMASDVKLASRAYAETSRLSCQVNDEAGSLSILSEDEYVLMDGAAKAFQGRVRGRERSDRGISTQRIWQLEFQDYTTDLGDDYVPAGILRTAIESDKTRIAWLGSTYGTKGVVMSGATVATLRASMPNQGFGGLTLHEAMTLICSVTGGSFYVDYDKTLHYYSSEVLSAPFGLSDNPNGSTTFGYHGLRLKDDTTSFANEVLVLGATGTIGIDSTVRYLGGTPPAAGTRRAAVHRDPEIKSLADAQAAGDAFLAKFGVTRQPSEIRTYQPGLRSGMTVPITHAGYGLAAVNYRISAVEAQPIDRDRIEYTIFLGASPISVASILRANDAKVAGAFAMASGAPGAAVAAVNDLSVGGGNLVANSSFEDQTSWTPGANWTIGFDPVSPQEPFQGEKTARMVGSTTTSDLQTPFMPISRLSTYWASAWLFCRSRTAGSVSVVVTEYNAASSLLATTTLGTISAASTEWERLKGKFANVAGVGVVAWNAATTKVRIIIRATGFSGTLDVDGVQFERGDLLTAYAASPYELIDGSVGTTKITDDAITSPKVAANAIVSGKIAAGVITSVEIAANSITADRLAVGAYSGGNLLINGDFETGSTSYSGAVPAWTLFASNEARVQASANAKSGTKILQLKSTSASVAVAATQRIPVIPGRTYRLSGWYWKAAAGGSGAMIRANTLDAAGATVNFDVITSTPNTTTTPVFADGYFLVPADGTVTYLRVDVLASGTVASTAEVFSFEDLTLELLPTNVQNLPGTVTIDSNGIVITNGAMQLIDPYGESVLTAAGFTGSWLTFLQRGGFYNGDFGVGDSADIVNSIVGSAGSLANYASSLSPQLPYWIVGARIADTFLRVLTTDSAAPSGRALAMTRTAGSGFAAAGYVMQDVPVTPGRHQRFDVLMRDVGSGGNIGVYVSWRDVNHAIIGSEVLSTTAGAGSTSYYERTGSTAQAGLPVAPPNTAYLRVRVELRVGTGVGTGVVIGALRLTPFEEVAAWEEFTPSWIGIGAGTMTAQGGYFLRLGNAVMLYAYGQVATNWTLASAIGLVLPVAAKFMDNRQIIPFAGSLAGVIADGHGVILETGSGANIDVIRVGGANVLGTGVDAGDRLVLQGMYLAAPLDRYP